MQIEKKQATDLLPAEYNPRKELKPGDSEYEKLKRSLEQFGYVEPVIWNKTIRLEASCVPPCDNGRMW